MDLSKLRKDYGGYSLPASFELAGTCLDVTFEGGDELRLDFAADPDRTISIGGVMRPYECVKIGPKRFFVSYADGIHCTSLVIDMATGLVTRHVADVSADISISSGAISPTIADGSDVATGDFVGNAFMWSFGPEPVYVVNAQYDADVVILSFPLLGGDAPTAAVSGFTVARIATGVYLQSASVTAGGKLYSVALVSDFNTMLCAGSVFGADATHRIIGGYGLPSDPGTALYRFNQFGLHSIIQFTPPPCYELAGRKFTLEMDDGDDFTLDFKGEEYLEWTWKSQSVQPERYACVKADDTTYLVSYELAGVSPRVNHTFVLDLEHMLVTRVVSTIGRNKRWPYLMTTEIEFGAIGQAGVEYKSYPRPSHTSDMVGNIVEWAYGSELSTTHAYHDAHFYRITFARSRAASLEEARAAYAFNNMADGLPSSDEPTDYIRIKEGMYLVSLTEKNCEKLLGASNGFRSNTLCFLQNYKGGGTVVGRGFGTSTTDAGDTETNIMIGAYGYFIGPADDQLQHLLTDPIPYIV